MTRRDRLLTSQILKLPSFFFLNKQKLDIFRSQSVSLAKKRVWLNLDHFMKGIYEISNVIRCIVVVWDVFQTLGILGWSYLCFLCIFTVSWSPAMLRPLESLHILLNIWGADRKNVWKLQNWVFGVPSSRASVATIRTNKHITFHVLSLFFFFPFLWVRWKLEAEHPPEGLSVGIQQRSKGNTEWCHGVRGPNTTSLWCRLRVRRRNVFIFIGGSFSSTRRSRGQGSLHAAQLLIGRGFPAASPGGDPWIKKQFLVIATIKEKLW